MLIIQIAAFLDKGRFPTAEKISSSDEKRPVFHLTHKSGRRVDFILKSDPKLGTVIIQVAGYLKNKEAVAFSKYTRENSLK